VGECGGKLDVRGLFSAAMWKMNPAFSIIMTTSVTASRLFRRKGVRTGRVAPLFLPMEYGCGKEPKLPFSSRLRFSW
jgi:hypothetical protein